MDHGPGMVTQGGQPNPSYVTAQQGGPLEHSSSSFISLAAALEDPTSHPFKPHHHGNFNWGILPISPHHRASSIRLASPTNPARHVPHRHGPDIDSTNMSAAAKPCPRGDEDWLGSGSARMDDRGHAHQQQGVPPPDKMLLLSRIQDGWGRHGGWRGICARAAQR